MAGWLACLLAYSHTWPLPCVAHVSFSTKLTVYSLHVLCLLLDQSTYMRARTQLSRLTFITHILLAFPHFLVSLTSSPSPTSLDISKHTCRYFIIVFLTIPLKYMYQELTTRRRSTSKTLLELSLCKTNMCACALGLDMCAIFIYVYICRSASTPCAVCCVLN